MAARTDAKRATPSSAPAVDGLVDNCTVADPISATLPCMGADWAELRHIAAGQEQVVADWQALLCGVSRRMIQRRLENGSWMRPAPGTISLTGQEPEFGGRVHAAALWGGKGSVIHGPASLILWELIESVPATIDLAVPERRNLRSRGNIRVKRRQIPAEDQATLNRVRVTSKAYSALFGAVLLGAAGQQVLDRALLRGLPIEDVRATLERNRCASGAAQARLWLAAAADGSAAESERLFARLLRQHHISGWVVNPGPKRSGRPNQARLHLSRRPPDRRDRRMGVPQ